MRSFAQRTQIAEAGTADRYAIAYAKNSDCVVCTKPIAAEELRTALLLEGNDRLVHPGTCSTEALRHQFAYARRGLRGRRSHRGGR